MRRYFKYIFSITFVLLIGIISLCNYPSLKESIQQPLDSFEESYNENFFWKMHLVDVNGIYMRALNKDVIKGVINVNDNLILDSDIVYDISIYEDDINYTKKVLDHAKLGGAKTLYVQHPTKVNEFLEFVPYNKANNAVNTDEYWLKQMSKGKYDVLDLTDIKYEANAFYKTDHHWTNKSSLNAAKAILEKLELDSSVCDVSNYTVDCYRSSLLGSAGIKVGEGYLGKDDFEIYYPEFETNLEYKHFVNGECIFESKGNFKDCFINYEIVNDSNYNNKYNAFLNSGYVENIVYNNKISNGSKLLIVSDSFARPMTQYLSLSFQETRYLDPQVGRYNESIIDYIDEYNPDYLIVMYSLHYETNLLIDELKK